jgi:hypothetical protein
MPLRAAGSSPGDTAPKRLAEAGRRELEDRYPRKGLLEVACLLVEVATGPLVALIDRRETLHGWTHQEVGTIQAPLLTCEVADGRYGSRKAGKSSGFLEGQAVMTTGS